MRSIFKILQCLEVLSTVLFSECADDIEQEAFAKDLLHFEERHRPAIVLWSLVEPSLSVWKLELLTLIISYDEFSDYATICKNLGTLIEDGEIDFILFWDSGHLSFIRALAEKVKLFSSKVTCFVDMGDSDAYAHMTLASRLYYYSRQESGIVDIFESYQIRGGPLVTNAIGTWSAADRLKVSEPNIWERRSNLQGELSYMMSKKMNEGKDSSKFV